MKKKKAEKIIVDDLMYREIRWKTSIYKRVKKSLVNWNCMGYGDDRAAVGEGFASLFDSNMVGPGTS